MSVSGPCDHNNGVALAVSSEVPDIGNAESCHASIPGRQIPGGVTLAINPEARVYASLHTPKVHATCPNVVCHVPVAIQNIGMVTAAVEATLVEPADGSVEVLWDLRPLAGGVGETRFLGIVTQLEGFVEVTISFCLPFELPDLGGRDRIRLVFASAQPTAT